MPLVSDIYFVYMNTKVIFNLPTTVKSAAARRAKRNGMTLSAVLARAAAAYGSGLLDIEMIDTRPLRPAVARAIKKAIAEAERGVHVSPQFDSAKDAKVYLRERLAK